MNDDQHDQVLFARFGTSSPCWRLSSDSNALELTPETDDDKATVAIALSGAQAAQIRRLTGVTAHLTMDVRLSGEALRLHLVGKKLNSSTWAGTASAYEDTESVARDLVHGLSFAEQVVSEVNSVVVIVDKNGRIQRFNRLAEELTGMKEEDVVGRSVWALFMSSEAGAASSQNISGFFNQGVAYEVERRVRTVHGERLFLFRNKFVMSGSGVDEQFLICSGTDITEERRAQERLSELANTDSLTGLPNRNAIHDKTRAAIASAAAGEAVGILFLDLDNFKKVNDHYGHVFGDRLIQDVSSAVRECLADDDTLARLGGDEFIVLSPVASVASMEAMAQRILERLRVPFSLGLVEVYTGCSIGIAMFPEHGDSLEALIRAADTAMYVAKDDGKRTYRVFSPEMNRKVAEYMWLDTNLRRGLEEGQLTLHYQPKLSLATGTVYGVEALVRWNSPERGQIMPAAFIRYAEESGLIGPLGRWVMETAAEQAAQWKSRGLSLRVAINVSARQLVDTAVVSHFTEALQRAQLDPCLLDIELTESCLIEDEAAAIDLITQFRNLGAQVHLDDFGTGYSSLSQLGRIPLDVIKLDRSFVSSINADRKSQALVRSMVAVAQALQLKVVAEGIETESEELFMKGLGVEYVQGFLYGKPMPAADFERWLHDRQKIRLIA
ncbi:MULTISPECIES: cyclic di-GMP phosphodiesterase [Paraburkholderia]|jgi:cyclic di-GMP phosphodiesterase Gmr|uniref:Cyclic di-GMP phosphodiesterase n=1 Tax=Paraburkholderia caribensis TaxID=75105 RepID=A0A9Q6WNC2_9BURK|nr:MULTISPECIES: cyclic di-GMP phosphodiesterase [Paraburkholderia]AMV45686.1 RNase II stability modulator [Paraburkholderia caribensis]MCO4883262.1 cyclic di-GMP phosphodiesterase [Paraburkholderia caribensis]MDR6382975.1 cyclic di-GMP phosphodiesterase Gmr [Paraburkholderia caribensis]PTB28109.1 cyclic di-GMP phosphodiesterase [Paraburkholderia caribensis]QLB64321.1 RNase II stability modulator [Paraburkholderia caribensis]